MKQEPVPVRVPTYIAFASAISCDGVPLCVTILYRYSYVPVMQRGSAYVDIRTKDSLSPVEGLNSSKTIVAHPPTRTEHENLHRIQLCRCSCLVIGR